MNFGAAQADRPARRILTAMIVAGACLTGLSFAMQIGSSTVKSRLHDLYDRAGAFAGSAEAPLR